ncbi:hypothetical protein N4G58_07980 [Edwardsiella piscicida]|nr:hypothetical protein N4G58_07980 [Edwardsiella piscicida]
MTDLRQRTLRIAGGLKRRFTVTHNKNLHIAPLLLVNADATVRGLYTLVERKISLLNASFSAPSRKSKGSRWGYRRFIVITWRRAPL